jgi:hypothetical protein
MKQQTVYHIGVRNVGDANQPIQRFSGKPEDLFPQVVAFLINLSIRTRVDLVLVRHAHEIDESFAKRDTKPGGQTASATASRLTTNLLAAMDFSNAKE